MALGLPQPSLLHQDNECVISAQIQHPQNSTFVQQQWQKALTLKQPHSKMQFKMNMNVGRNFESGYGYLLHMYR